VSRGAHVVRSEGNGIVFSVKFRAPRPARINFRLSPRVRECAIESRPLSTRSIFPRDSLPFRVGSLRVERHDESFDHVRRTDERKRGEAIADPPTSGWEMSRKPARKSENKLLLRGLLDSQEQSYE
jgi:hypothetical protein